jgi:hypothetical protein
VATGLLFQATTMPQIHHGLFDRYGDLIINSLDLLSFILITPEILRRVVPQISRFAIVILFLGPAILVMLLIPYLLDFLTRIVGVFSILIVIALWLFMGNYLSNLYTRRDNLLDWMSKHGFMLGVATFFAARVLAFFAALAHALS